MKKVAIFLTLALAVLLLLYSVGVAQEIKKVKKGDSTSAQKVGTVLLYYSFDNCKDIFSLPNCNCKNKMLECSEGVKKSALMFKGKGDHIVHENKATRSFTVTFWMRTRDVGSNTAGGKFYGCTGLVDAGSTSSNNVWGIALCEDKIGFGVGETTILSTSSVNTGKFVFVAATRDFETGNIKLYINGKLEAEANDVAKGVVLDGSKDIYIGAHHIQPTLASVKEQSYYFGCIDELKVFYGVLSADKINKMYDELNPYKVKLKPQVQKQEEVKEPTFEGLPR